MWTAMLMRARQMMHVHGALDGHGHGQDAEGRTWVLLGAAAVPVAQGEEACSQAGGRETAREEEGATATATATVEGHWSGE